MRKSWPFALVVIVVGGLAGLAIAGRPVPADTFVVGASATTRPTELTTSTIAATTTTLAAVSTTTSIAPTTVASSTTSAAPIITTTTTTVSATTTIADASTTTEGPVSRDQIKLVLANGDGRFRLASTTADRIRPLGYTIDLGDALEPATATVVYYRPGLQREAAILAKDLLVPNAILTEYPSSATQPITTSDDNGDLIVVLGPDAPR